MNEIIGEAGKNYGTIGKLNKRLLVLKRQRRTSVAEMLEELVGNVNNADDLVVELNDRYNMKLYNTNYNACGEERPVHYILDKRRNLIYNLDRKLDDRVINVIYDNRDSIGNQLYDLMSCEVERLALEGGRME